MSEGIETGVIETRSRRYRWVVLAAVWLLYAAFGLCMRSITPVVTPVLNDLGMTYGEMGFIMGSWQLVYIPVAIFAGFAIDRFGIRKSLLAGALIVAFSEGLRYFATGFLTLLPLVALFGVGGPLISIGAPKVVSSWFKGGDRAAAVGIYTTAPWIGGLFAIAATNSLVMPATGGSWRLTMLFYGILSLIFAVFWGVFARDTKGNGESSSHEFLKTFKTLMKTRNVRIILTAGLLTLFVEHGYSHWVVKMLEDGGFTSQNAGFMAAIPLIAAIPSVLLLPRYIPAGSRGRFLAVLSVMMGVGLLLSYIGPSWIRTLGLIVYGIAAPPLLPIQILALMDEPGVGPGYMGLAGGIFFCFAEIGGFTGPLIMGGILDLSDSFLPGVLLFMATTILLGLTSLLLRTGRS